MRFGIDAYFASYELRGIGKYVVQLVRGLVSADPSNEYVIYGDAFKFRELSGCERVRFRDPKGITYPIWEQFVLPEWVLKDQVEILHCPANTGPLVMNRHIRLLLTIHDVMYLLPRQTLQPSKVMRQQLGNAYRRFIVPRVVQRADAVITVSEFSKRQICEYLLIEKERVQVVYEGVSADFASLSSREAAAVRQIGATKLDSPFVLALGAGDPRKNTVGVIRAYAAARESLPGREKLVIAGMRDWRHSEAFRLVQKLNLSNDVLFTGYVSEENLAWLYSQAKCFLYPTFYEGFGFPILEAMACGTPVISSNCTSVPEIAGDAAILLDPSSPHAIGAAMVRVLNDDALRRVLIDRGKARVGQMGWQSTIDKTLNMYSVMARGAAAERVAEARLT